MKKFQDWPVFNKVLTLVLLILIGFSLFTYLDLLPLMERRIFEEKETQTKNLVQSTNSIIEYWHSKASAGALTEEQAQKQALEEIGSLRYNENDYFWVNNFEGTMLMHPIKKALNGTSILEIKDPNGFYLFREFIKVCKEKGSGYVNYLWPKPGFDRPVQKTSYVQKTKYWDWIVGTGIYVNDVEERMAAFKQKILIGLFVAFVFIILLSYFAAKKIIGPLKYLQDAANKLSVGDTDFTIIQHSTDEFGMLEEAFAQMLEDTRTKAKLADELARGNTNIEIPVRSDNDVLSKSLASMVASLRDLVHELKEITVAAASGNLKFRGNNSRFDGSFHDIIIDVNQTLDAVTIPLADGSETLAQMSSGNFTAQMQDTYQGDYRILKSSIDQLGASLTGVILDIKNAIDQMTNAVQQVGISSRQLTQGAEQQGNQVADIANSVERMNITIKESSLNAISASEAARQAGIIAKEGGEIVTGAVAGMDKIAVVVQAASGKVRELGNSSDQIGEIIQVIEDIAAQTNLLALNAAIEAARAGEQGRGFAVVADEVKKLAERTAKATQEIASMIKRIQSETEEVVHSMEKGTAEVLEGTRLANRAGASLRDIITSTEKVVDIITRVADAGQEQTAAVDAIARNVEGISDVIRQSGSEIHQVAQTAEAVNQIIVQFESLIGKFQIHENKQVALRLK